MSFSAERSYKAKNDKSFKKQEQPKVAYENMPRLPLDRALTAHADAMNRGARCPECPLFGLRVGPVMGTIVPNSRLTIIDEGPRQSDIEQKRLFVGRPGDILNQSLLEGGVAREECTLTSAVLCRAPEEMKAFEARLKIMHDLACAKARENGEPEPPPPMTPATACFPRLQRDVQEGSSRHILAIGTAGLKSVADIWNVPFGSGRKVKAGEVRISSLKKQLGSPITMPDGTIVVASYHPAFAMRPGSRHYMHVIQKHITRAAEISRRGHIDWKEPEYILNPSIEVIETVLRSMHGKDKTIDIETDKGKRADGKFDPFSCRIRCIGFGAFLKGPKEPETIIVVPIRHISGHEWWNETADKKRVLQACMDALNDESINESTGEPAMLVGHNLAFDTSVLLRFKLLLRRDRVYDDTMLLHHDTPDNDLPHDLGFVAARYFEVPSWKSGADDKVYDNVTDYDLHLYNAKDVLTTMRLRELLVDEIYRYGTVDQYMLDQKLAPVARDMGELGLFIDEVKRGELSLKMNKEAYSRLLKLKQITGDPKFNPASPHQIRKFLFVTKKHIPMLNTQGKEWADGEDPSTNTTALTKMASSQGCDQQTKDFINTLLEYRAYMKLKGTYIDKLRVHYPDWKKEFGLDIPELPEVKGPVWVEYSKWRRKPRDEDPFNWVPPPSKEAIAEERWPEEWATASAPVPKDLTKDEKEKAKQERKARMGAILDRVEDGEWQEAVVIPARPALSRLYTTYKLHVIPSGRMSTSPAVQNWPKFGKANMHEMIIAPPGHVMVGADLDQVELRLYAAIANDKLLVDAFTKPGPDGKPFDPHSLNAASLFAKKFGKSILDTYMYIMGLPDMQAGMYAKAAIDKATKEGISLGASIQDITPDFVKRFNTAVKAHTDLSGNLDVDAAAQALGVASALVKACHAGSKQGDKEKKKLRGYAKTFAYLECYGGEADKLFAYMSTARDKATGALMFPDLKEEDVHEWHREWHKNHPETKAWQDACQRVARKEGFTAAPMGSYRKRFFPGGPNKPGATFNHVIQSSAAEIANAALLKIAKAIPYQKWSPFTGVCLQIHDYIGMYVPAEHGEEAKQIIEAALNSEISNGIKITASAVISDGLATQ